MWNIKPREVECPRCKRTRITDNADPQCDECKISMITILYSTLTGERLGGKQ